MNLTSLPYRDYSVAQVLLTPKFERKRTSAPDRERFFFAHSFLWSGVRGIKHLRGITPPVLRQVRSARPPAYCSGQLPSKERKIMTALTILSTKIRQHDGLYSLNDLHKAAGGESSQRPSYFLNNKQTNDLIEEIQIAGIPAILAKQGLGTYACRELVIAYAAWISAAFHLKVIRVFLEQAKPELPAAITADQIEKLIQKQLQKSLPVKVAHDCLLPPDQTKEIMDRLDRLGKMFHPFSDQFLDVLGVIRALRGCNPKLGLEELGYRKVI